MSKKRILFIIWSFTYGGGAEKILANIVNHLDHEKYDIEVLEYYHSNVGKETVDQRVKILKPIIDSTRKDLFSRVKNRLVDRILLKFCPGFIRRIYLNRTYDVEISFNYLIPTFLLNRDSGKLISWIHGSIHDLKGNKERKKKQKKYLDQVDSIVAISNETKQSILEIFPEYQCKLQKIYNGYDFERMIPNDDNIEDFQLLYCNRFDANKNPLFLIEVAKHLKDDGVDFKLMMLGAGDLLDKAKAYVKQYGLDRQIKFAGYVKNPYAYFNRCKVFCLTSYIEGFPTTLVESMHFGKPFVSTPVAGTEELSQGEKCGFVESDITEYAKKVKCLLTNPDLYASMSQNCKEEVRNYSLQKQIQAIEDLIDT